MPEHIALFRKYLERDGLAPWPRYENDPSFRQFIDMGSYAHAYSFLWWRAEAASAA